MAILELEDVHLDYAGSHGKTVAAVRGVSLSVESSQIIALVGESGCGKSSLARCAVGLVATTSGAVRFRGEPIGHKRRRTPDEVRLQLVFQNPYSSLNPRRRVGRQLADGLKHIAVPKGEWPGRVTAALEHVGLSAADARSYPHQFSGGQRQRIALARALATSPEVVVLDEPFASLDASAQARLANLLMRLRSELGTSFVVLSHDLSLVMHIADIVAVMYMGRVAEIGPAEQIHDNPVHPYTKALIAAVPIAGQIGKLPVGLGGEVPDPTNVPPGCSFHPRCRFAFDKCRSDDPPLISAGESRQAACWLMELDHGKDSRTDHDTIEVAP